MTLTVNVSRYLSRCGGKCLLGSIFGGKYQIAIARSGVPTDCKAKRLQDPQTFTSRRQTSLFCRCSPSNFKAILSAALSRLHEYFASTGVHLFHRIFIFANPSLSESSTSSSRIADPSDIPPICCSSCSNAVRPSVRAIQMVAQLA